MGGVFRLSVVIGAAALLAIILFVGYAVLESTKNTTYAVVAIMIGLFIPLMITAHQIFESLGWNKAEKRIPDFLMMSPYDFEQYVGGLFRRMGYSAQVTQKSDGKEGGDYGADVIAKKDGQTIVVQVKKWAPHNLVGAPDVRSVLGCMHTFRANKAILLTTSDFTEQAKIQAKDAPIELWNGVYLQKLLREYT